MRTVEEQSNPVKSKLITLGETSRNNTNLKYFKQMAGSKRIAICHDIISKVGIGNVGLPQTSAPLKMTEAVFDVNPSTGKKMLTVAPVAKQYS